MLSAALMSSRPEHWNTPPTIVEVVRSISPIALDPCSNAGSVVHADTELTRDEDGLSASWAEICRAENGASMGLVYVNPPYGRSIGDWVAKAAREAKEGAEIVLLIPARTDTGYWHDWIYPTADLVCYVRGRIRFIGESDSGAPFPSALVYWGSRVDRAAEVLRTLGALCYSERRRACRD